MRVLAVLYALAVVGVITFTAVTMYENQVLLNERQRRREADLRQFHATRARVRETCPANQVLINDMLYPGYLRCMKPGEELPWWERR